jgi:hypothetical protein
LWVQEANAQGLCRLKQLPYGLRKTILRFFDRLCQLIKSLNDQYLSF